MKKIRTIYEKDVFPSKEESSNITYADRNTGKAIVIDDEGKIALVGNKQNEFLLLPGGGIDDREDIRSGIMRECLEEIGCKVSIADDIGLIDDFRPRDKKHCINRCFTARVVGKKGSPIYTEEESRIGMYTIWVKPTDALEILKNQKKSLDEGKVAFYNTGYNILRDLLFLEEAISIDAIHV